MAKVLWPLFMLCFLLYVALTFFWAGLYRNYVDMPWLLILPLGCAASFLASGHFLYRTGNMLKAFLYSGAGIIFLALTGVMGIYPNLLPSRLSPLGSVSIADAASTPKTLLIMLVVALIFVPIVILYQLWVHRKFSDKLNPEY